MISEELKNKYLKLRKKIIANQFKQMNDMQIKAVVKAKGPVLILAGAGSGKTTVLVNRIANLVKYGDAYESDYIPPFVSEDDISLMENYLKNGGNDEQITEIIAPYKINPWNILAITFTNKAANELRGRLSLMLGDMAENINAATFHSTCVRILRREGERLGYEKSFAIYDTDDSLRVIKNVMKNLNIEEKLFPPKSILSQMGRFKDSLISPEEAMRENEVDFRLSKISRIYAEYQKELKKSNAMDFDDIITQTVKLFQENEDILEKYRNKYRYIMVDEYQDTNNSQYMLVSLLSEKHHNLCVVGDDDQSIYKFRGATIENILNFEKQFPNTSVIRLEQNYRSTQTILDAANNVIKNNSARKGKNLWTDKGMGKKIKVYRSENEMTEAQFIADKIEQNIIDGAAYSDNAILYRMNAQSNTIERALLQRSIPYKIFGGLKFYERKEIKDVISYLSVINNPNDKLRLKRIINEPKRGIGAATVEICETIADTIGLSLFEVMDRAEEYAPLQRKSKLLKDFTAMLKEIMCQIDSMPLSEYLDLILEKTGYMEMLKAEGVQGETRIDNVEELKTNMIKYEAENEESSLAGFLEEIALYTDLDNYDDSDVVMLMTLHSAKGLEFPYVFIAGMENNIFPSALSRDSLTEMEEERRLAYVGITRAKKELYLTCAQQRMVFGKTNFNPISSFIKEIPAELCDFEDKTYRKSTENENQTFGRANPRINRGGNFSTPKPTPFTPKAAPATYSAGDLVEHNVFGMGTVISAKSMGNDSLLEISFEKVGTRKIMANFAKMKKLS